jgi:hypothetical protein
MAKLWLVSASDAVEDIVVGIIAKSKVKVKRETEAEFNVAAMSVGRRIQGFQHRATLSPSRCH